MEAGFHKPRRNFSALRKDGRGSDHGAERDWIPTNGCEDALDRENNSRLRMYQR